MKKAVYIFLAALLLVLLSSCTQIGNLQNEEENTVEQESAAVYLTDRPLADVDQLIVSIPSVTYHFEIEGEASDVTVNVATEVDLLSLAGTEVKFFDLSQIPEDATLAWIGMNIADATAVVDGEEYPVKVPSDMIKVLVNATVSSDTEVVLDFDVSRSLIYIPSPVKEFRYILKPVITHYMRNKHMAKVYGKVTDEDGNAVDFALITLTKEDESTPMRFTLTSRKGFYMMGGIMEGKYTISVYTDYTLPESEDGSLTLGTPAATKNIEVKAGEKLEVNFNNIKVSR